jgi:hypothetical protein
MTTALIACGALAREVLALKEKHGWDADVLGVPSLLHNTPDRIPEAVRERIHAARARYDRVVVVYGDCGTGGRLDELLAAEGVERVAGPHCYEMYANGEFEKFMADHPGTYFLTDYLVQSFDHLVVEGMGLDRFPNCATNIAITRVVYSPNATTRAARAVGCRDWACRSNGHGYGALKRAWSN